MPENCCFELLADVGEPFLDTTVYRTHNCTDFGIFGIIPPFADEPQCQQLVQIGSTLLIQSYFIF